MKTALFSLVLFPFALGATASATMLGPDPSTIVLQEIVAPAPESGAEFEGRFKAQSADEQLTAQHAGSDFPPQHCWYGHHHCGGHEDLPQAPLPPAFWLLGSALIAVAGVARRRIARQP